MCNTTSDSIPNTSQAVCFRYIILMLIRSDKSTASCASTTPHTKQLHSTSYTQGCQSPFSPCPLKCMKQSHRYAGTWTTDKYVTYIKAKGEENKKKPFYDWMWVWFDSFNMEMLCSVSAHTCCQEDINACMHMQHIHDMCMHVHRQSKINSKIQKLKFFYVVITWL